MRFTCTDVCFNGAYMHDDIDHVRKIRRKGFDGTIGLIKNAKDAVRTNYEL